MSKQTKQNPNKPKRRVSFHNRTSVLLFKKKGHSKSLSLAEEQPQELTLNDIQIFSPETENPSTEEINSLSMHLATQRLSSLDLASPDSNMSMSLSTRTSRRKSSNFFSDCDNTTTRFFLPSELEDKENEDFLNTIGSSNDISMVIEPSILDLVEADQNDELTCELENTEDFLLGKEALPTEEDSFTCFCIESPSSEGEKSNASDFSCVSRSSDESMGSLSEQIDVDEFLSMAQIHFRIFDKTPRKISLGFPSDSLTSLLSFCADSDPAVSTFQLSIKRLLLSNGVDYRSAHHAFIKTELENIHAASDELEEDLSIDNPPIFTDIENNLPAKRVLKLWQRSCTRQAKILWYKSSYKRLHEAYNHLLQSIQIQLSHQLEKIKDNIINSVNEVNGESNSILSYTAPSKCSVELEEELLEHMDQLDTMYGLIQWKLVKNEQTTKTQSLTLRFGYCNYELSFQSNTTSPSYSTLFSCVLYQNYPSPVRSNSLIDEKKDQIIQFIMSKSPLIQQTNRYDQLPGLLEEFTILFTRALDFFDNVSSFLRKNQIRCTHIEYKSVNEQIYEIGQGRFNIQLSCQEIGKKLFPMRFRCDFISGTVSWQKNYSSIIDFLPQESPTISLHSLTDLTNK